MSTEPGQIQEPGIQPMLPIWLAGTQISELSLAASHSAQYQKTGSEMKPELEPQESDMGFEHPKRHLHH